MRMVPPSALSQRVEQSWEQEGWSKTLLAFCRFKSNSCRFSDFGAQPAILPGEQVCRCKPCTASPGSDQADTSEYFLDASQDIDRAPALCRGAAGHGLCSHTVWASPVLTQPGPGLGRTVGSKKRGLLGQSHSHPSTCLRGALRHPAHT